MDDSRGLRNHYCLALECDVPVDPRLLMCSRHWDMVPRAIKQQVYRTYRRGQERDKSPSREYLVAARAAVIAVEEAQGCRVPWWIERGID